MYVTTVALKLHTCKPNTNTQRKLTCAFVYKRQITPFFGITWFKFATNGTKWRRLIINRKWRRHDLNLRRVSIGYTDSSLEYADLSVRAILTITLTLSMRWIWRRSVEFVLQMLCLHMFYVRLLSYAILEHMPFLRSCWLNCTIGLVTKPVDYSCVVTWICTAHVLHVKYWSWM